MATDDALRKRAQALIKAGVTQKAIAAAMDVSTSWFSRWYRDTEGLRLRVDEMDRFDAFTREVAATALGVTDEANRALIGDIAAKVAQEERELRAQRSAARPGPSDRRSARESNAKSGRR